MSLVPLAPFLLLFQTSGLNRRQQRKQRFPIAIIQTFVPFVIFCSSAALSSDFRSLSSVLCPLLIIRSLSLITFSSRVAPRGIPPIPPVSQSLHSAFRSSE